MKPRDDFGTALERFEQLAAQRPVVGSALTRDAAALEEWRRLCESLDWITKQPGVRQPMETGWCISCGAANRVPAVELTGSCTRCGNDAYARPIQCTSCGVIGGIGEDVDPRSIVCPQCGVKRFVWFRVKSEKSQHRRLWR